MTTTATVSNKNGLVRKLYLAYGANTNHEHMAMRCPDSVYIGTHEVKDYRLVFRGPCDIQAASKTSVVCALWNISQDDEESLDFYEGYPDFYGKQQIMLDNSTSAFVYIMTEKHKTLFQKPGLKYYDLVSQGYRDCGISQNQLHHALNYTESNIYE